MKSVHQSHHTFESYQVTGKKTFQYYIRSIQYFDKEDGSQQLMDKSKICSVFEAEIKDVTS